MCGCNSAIAANHHHKVDYTKAAGREGLKDPNNGRSQVSSSLNVLH